MKLQYLRQCNIGVKTDWWNRIHIWIYIKTNLTKVQRTQWRKYTLFQQMVLEQLDIHVQKTLKLWTKLTTYIKINWKFIVILNVKPKVIKFIIENLVRKSLWTWFRQIILRYNMKTTVLKRTN